MGPTNDKQRSNLKAADSHVATLKSLAAAGLDGVGALLFADKFTDFAAAHGVFAAAHGDFAAAHGVFAAAQGDFASVHAGFELPNAESVR